MGILRGIGHAKSGPKATQKQLDFLESLIDQTGSDVEVDWENITIAEASELIDELQEELEDVRPCW